MMELGGAIPSRKPNRSWAPRPFRLNVWLDKSKSDIRPLTLPFYIICIASAVSTIRICYFK